MSSLFLLTGIHNKRDRPFISKETKPLFIFSSNTIILIIFLLSFQMATIASLLCVITMTYNHGGYLSLPNAWRFRVFVFTSVVSLLFSVFILVCRTTNLARLMPLNWILLVSTKIPIFFLFVCLYEWC